MHLMARDIDRNHSLTTEIPLQVGNDKWGDETTTGCIDMDRGIQPLFNKQIIHCLDVLVFSRVRGTYNVSMLHYQGRTLRTKDAADSDSILIYQIDSLLCIDNVSVLSAVNKLLLDLKVSSRLLPANLDS